VRVALVRVLAGLEGDRPDPLADERDGGGLVDARADEMEVVDRGLVLDLDLVGAGLDRLQILAGQLDLDRVPGANLTG
jgi:hypothetical protein